MTKPTLSMSKHDVAGKLWQHGEHDAYYNLLGYIKQGDEISDNLRQLILDHVALIKRNDALYSQLLDSQTMNDQLNRQLDMVHGALIEARALIATLNNTYTPD